MGKNSGMAAITCGDSSWVEIISQSCKSAGHFMPKVKKRFRYKAEGFI
jgi:hypothetical protein